MDENGYRALARMLKDGCGVTRRTFLDGKIWGTRRYYRHGRIFSQQGER